MHIHLYDVVLFLHIAVAIGSFVVAAGMHLAMLQLRAGTTVSELRMPAQLLHRTEPLLPLFAVALLGLGSLLLHLSGGQFRWSDGWVVTAVATLAVVELLGGTVLAPRGKLLGRLIATSHGEKISATLDCARHDVFLWVGGHAATGAIVGVVFLMTTKPAGATGVLVVLAATALGAATGVPFTRPISAARSRATQRDSTERPAHA